MNSLLFPTPHHYAFLWFIRILKFEILITLLPTLTPPPLQDLSSEPPFALVVQHPPSAQGFQSSWHHKNKNPEQKLDGATTLEWTLTTNADRRGKVHIYSNCRRQRTRVPGKPHSPITTPTEDFAHSKYPLRKYSRAMWHGLRFETHIKSEQLSWRPQLGLSLFHQGSKKLNQDSLPWKVYWKSDWLNVVTRFPALKLPFQTFSKHQVLESELNCPLIVSCVEAAVCTRLSPRLQQRPILAWHPPPHT